MEKKVKDIQFKKRFKFKKEHNEYTLQLKKRRNYWWLLLFLLPLLLFIRCDHDIVVTTMDSEANVPLSGVQVSMSYTPHVLLDSLGFMAHQEYVATQVTDSTGTTVFKDVKCDVFSYIFYCVSKASFTVSSNCYELSPDPVEKPYHYVRNVTLNMQAKREDVKLVVKDKEKDYPLAGAKIEYQYVEGGQQRSDTVTSNANGVAVVKNFLSCGVFRTIKVSCYGYVDTMAVDRYASTIRQYADTATFRLRPEKQSFSYYVKNKESGQPIPGATCVVTLTDSKNNTTRGTSKTNVDGLGKGMYNDAFILANVDIQASKPLYKPGKLEGNYTVVQFAALPDSQRVIYLEPEAFVKEFQNVDSITGKPIVGVTNIITVTDFKGNVVGKFEEVSNSNGYFPVKAKEGYKIDIVSKLEPEYITKDTHIASFSSGEVIKMMPDKVDITFRTIDEETGELVPNCDLVVTTSLSKITIPTNSDTGEFTVKGLYRGETISIVASKKDYETNNKKIKNIKVEFLLNAYPGARDIPMKLILPDCNVKPVKHETSGVVGRQVASFNLNKRSGTLSFSYYTDNAPDRIQIYNCAEADIPNNKPIWDTGKAISMKQAKRASVPFNYPIITIVGISEQEGSYWEVNVECP